MARADHRDEALSFAEGMLGEAQYRTASVRFQSSLPMRSSQRMDQTALVPVFQGSCRSREQIPWRSIIVTMELRAYKELGGTDALSCLAIRASALAVASL